MEVGLYGLGRARTLNRAPSGRRPEPELMGTVAAPLVRAETAGS